MHEIIGFKARYAPNGKGIITLKLTNGNMPSTSPLGAPEFTSTLLMLIHGSASYNPANGSIYIESGANAHTIELPIIV